MVPASRISSWLHPNHPGQPGGVWRDPVPPAWAPSEKKVEKKRRKAPKCHSMFELFVVLSSKMERSFFLLISGWCPNRLVDSEDSGGQKHQKGRSTRSLFEAFSARAGFLKSELPPARELNSQGPTPPKSDSKWCVFCKVFAEGALKPHFCLLYTSPSPRDRG